MSYTKEQILEYLNGQQSLVGAINNIDYIGSNRPMIVDTFSGKTLFFVEEGVTTRGQLKEAIIKFDMDRGAEMSGHEELMELDELLEYSNMKLVK